MWLIMPTEPAPGWTAQQAFSHIGRLPLPRRFIPALRMVPFRNHPADRRGVRCPEWPASSSPRTRRPPPPWAPLRAARRDTPLMEERRAPSAHPLRRMLVEPRQAYGIHRLPAAVTRHQFPAPGRHSRRRHELNPPGRRTPPMPTLDPAKCTSNAPRPATSNRKRAGGTGAGKGQKPRAATAGRSRAVGAFG